jgi:membrane protein involved in colicin uptake
MSVNPNDITFTGKVGQNIGIDGLYAQIELIQNGTAIGNIPIFKDEPIQDLNDNEIDNIVNDIILKSPGLASVITNAIQSVQSPSPTQSLNESALLVNAVANTVANVLSSVEAEIPAQSLNESALLVNAVANTVANVLSSVEAEIPSVQQLVSQFTSSPSPATTANSIKVATSNTVTFTASTFAKVKQSLEEAQIDVTQREANTLAANENLIQAKTKSEEKRTHLDNLRVKEREVRDKIKGLQDTIGLMKNLPESQMKKIEAQVKNKKDEAAELEIKIQTAANESLAAEAEAKAAEAAEEAAKKALVEAEKQLQEQEEESKKITMDIQIAKAAEEAAIKSAEEAAIKAAAEAAAEAAAKKALVHAETSVKHALVATTAAEAAAEAGENLVNTIAESESKKIVSTSAVKLSDKLVKAKLEAAINAEKLIQAQQELDEIKKKTEAAAATGMTEENKQELLKKMDVVRLAIQEGDITLKESQSIVDTLEKEEDEAANLKGKEAHDSYKAAKLKAEEEMKELAKVQIETEKAELALAAAKAAEEKALAEAAAAKAAWEASKWRKITPENFVNWAKAEKTKVKAAAEEEAANKAKKDSEWAAIVAAAEAASAAEDAAAEAAQAEEKAAAEAKAAAEKERNELLEQQRLAEWWARKAVEDAEFAEEQAAKAEAAAAKAAKDKDEKAKRRLEWQAKQAAIEAKQAEEAKAAAKAKKAQADASLEKLKQQAEERKAKYNAEVETRGKELDIKENRTLEDKNKLIMTKEKILTRVQPVIETNDDLLKVGGIVGKEWVIDEDGYYSNIEKTELFFGDQTISLNTSIKYSLNNKAKSFKANQTYVEMIEGNWLKEKYNNREWWYNTTSKVISFRKAETREELLNILKGEQTPQIPLKIRSLKKIKEEALSEIGITAVLDSVIELTNREESGVNDRLNEIKEEALSGIIAALKSVVELTNKEETGVNHRLKEITELKEKNAWRNQKAQAKKKAEEDAEAAKAQAKKKAEEDAEAEAQAKKKAEEDAEAEAQAKKKAEEDAEAKKKADEQAAQAPQPQPLQPQPLQPPQQNQKSCVVM